MDGRIYPRDREGDKERLVPIGSSAIKYIQIYLHEIPYMFHRRQ